MTPTALTTLMDGVDIVLHAAGLKHVSLRERREPRSRPTSWARRTSSRPRSALEWSACC